MPPAAAAIGGALAHGAAAAGTAVAHGAEAVGSKVGSAVKGAGKGLTNGQGPIQGAENGFKGTTAATGENPGVVKDASADLKDFGKVNNAIQALSPQQPASGGGNFQNQVPSLSPISSAQRSGQPAPVISPIAGAPTNPLAQVTPQVTPGGRAGRINDPDEEARAAGGAPQSSGLL